MFQTIIKDFQSIDEAKINVDGVTIIVGETNSGKSACLRAIEAACLNRFKMGQVKQGRDYACIKFRVDKEGPILTVARNYLGGSPRIQLGSHVFTKLGRTLPKEVATYLNIGEVSINGERYSATFHPQFSKPMLMEYSQQKVMEILSASVEFDRLKNAKELVLSDRAKCKGAVEAVQKIVEDTRVQALSAKKYLEEVKPLVNDISSKIDEFIELSNKVSAIENCIKACKALESISAKVKILTTLLNTVTTIESLKEQSDKVAQLTLKLDLLESFKKKETIYSSIIPYATELSTINSDISNVNELSQALSDHTTVVNKIEILKQLVALSGEDYNSKLSKVTQLQTAIVTLSEVKKIGRKAINYKDLSSAVILRQKFKSELHETQLKLTSLLEKQSALTNVDNQVKQLVDIVDNHICPICGNKME